MCSIHEIKFEQRHLLKDYGSQKNHLKNMCSGDCIFNLDADELPNKYLIKLLHLLSLEIIIEHMIIIRLVKALFI